MTFDDTPFHLLADRELDDLTLDDRESLEYHYAAINLAAGLPADTEPRRWCVTIRAAEQWVEGNPCSAPRPWILSWIDEQASLRRCGYQRARIAALTELLTVQGPGESVWS